MKAILNGPQGRITLESTVATIGSSPDNLLIIDNPKVSAHHAEFRLEEQGYSITDLGSIHGTYVNGERLDLNTPHRLNRGNSITIGDTVFTYEEEETQSDASQPSILDQVNSPGASLPAAEIPSSHSAYEGGNVGMLPGNQQVTEANPLYTLPQQYMQPTYPGTMPNYGGPIPVHVPVAQPKRTRRPLIWIGVGLILVVILAVVGYLFFARSTPEKTLDAYCNALQGQDYQAAYNQLSAALQSTETELAFAHASRAVGQINACTHSSATVTGNLATANVTLVSIAGQTSSSIITLTQDSGSWKISMLPTTPGITLTMFCNALRSRDYPTAYNQLSGGIRKQRTEAQFETDFAGLTCSYGTVTISGNSASTSMTFMDLTGRTGRASVTLIQDSDSNNDWKIDSIQIAQ
jgi:hypothetical protein